MTQTHLGPMPGRRTHHSGLQPGKASIEDQLVALMDRYETAIYAYLLAILCDPERALSCAQDTFLRAFEALCRHGEIDRRWLYAHAHDRALDELRRGRRVGRDRGNVSAKDPHAGGMTELHSALHRLDPMDRAVLHLIEVAEFTTDEMGAILRMRGSAARRCLVGARERLRALCSSGCDATVRLRAMQPECHPGIAPW